VEREKLFVRKIFGDTSRVQARAEQAFVGIDVSNPTQDPLIEQQGLYASAPRSNTLAEILRADLERLFAQMTGELLQPRFWDNQHSAKAPDVGVTQLAAIIEDKKAMCVGHNGFVGTNYGQSTRHSKMDDEIKLRKWSDLRSSGLEPDAYEFAHSRDVRDPHSGEAFRNRLRRFDEVRFAEAHFDNGAARERQTQSAHNCLDLRKLRHRGVSFKVAQ